MGVGVDVGVGDAVGVGVGAFVGVGVGFSVGVGEGAFVVVGVGIEVGVGDAVGVEEGLREGVGVGGLGVLVGRGVLVGPDGLVGVGVGAVWQIPFPKIPPHFGQPIGHCELLSHVLPHARGGVGVMDIHGGQVHPLTGTQLLQAK